MGAKVRSNPSVSYIVRRIQESPQLGESLIHLTEEEIAVLENLHLKLQRLQDPEQKKILIRDIAKALFPNNPESGELIVNELFSEPTGEDPMTTKSKNTKTEEDHQEITAVLDDTEEEPRQSKISILIGFAVIVIAIAVHYLI
mmetsp:Transcript_4669/g.5388  ORF Transcript_4669/g.5388 Transcript_4669/m.5388 type:complete len:143 (+) Transcript_4669:72-500(+)|eukprot:CAMPEP_0194131106 /NCGR_PEP_ID=MMETSP0152-20130528/1937_1 /TAXON_ID=1049557 /ORGANISM="Thalassiothrix antarctica, Strain L6-D1" /LENGTH=142 /DNA_ID=CAMNT_0038825779 /DNA_START=31 /DNA_END=459 /DNA_ORIENTATION=-